MDTVRAQELVAQTGRQLLDMGLVARTWGNISCRIDKTHCAITPSGLDYRQMKAEDTVLLDIESGKWQGNHSRRVKRAYIWLPTDSSLMQSL